VRPRALKEFSQSTNRPERRSPQHQLENLNGSVMLYARNVRRWKDGTMILRWVGSALHEAQKQFRRLKGFRDMKRLVAALDRLNTHSGVELKKRGA
jgi:hypothetical protein